MCFNWLTYYREVIYKFYNRLVASVKFLLHSGAMRDVYLCRFRLYSRRRLLPFANIMDFCFGCKLDLARRYCYAALFNFCFESLVKFCDILFFG